MHISTSLGPDLWSETLLCLCLSGASGLCLGWQAMGTGIQVRVTQTFLTFSPGALFVRVMYLIRLFAYMWCGGGCVFSGA